MCGEIFAIFLYERGIVMTGRELIIYIMKNNLEDEPVVDENGKPIGYITVSDAAKKLGMGEAGVVASYTMGILEGVCIGDTLYISGKEVT